MFDPIGRLAEPPDCDADIVAPTNLFRRHLPQPTAVLDEAAERRRAAEDFNSLSACLGLQIALLRDKIGVCSEEVSTLAAQPGSAPKIRGYLGDLAHWLRLARQMVDIDRIDNPSDRASGFYTSRDHDHTPASGVDLLRGLP